MHLKHWGEYNEEYRSNGNIIEDLVLCKLEGAPNNHDPIGRAKGEGEAGGGGKRRESKSKKVDLNLYHWGNGRPVRHSIMRVRMRAASAAPGIGRPPLAVRRYPHRHTKAYMQETGTGLAHFLQVNDSCHFNPISLCDDRTHVTDF